jgi:hypothetical protein
MRGAGAMTFSMSPKPEQRRLVLLAAVVIVALVVGPARRSEAVFGVADTGVFHDPIAFAQRASQFIENIAQVRAILSTAREEYDLVKGIWKGVKDWRSLDWIDTLDIFQAPWLDGVEGIDGIRQAALAASLSADQIKGLWSDLGDFAKDLEGSSRYQRDPWFRAKIRSLMRESQQARQTRLAFFRQLKAHNKRLSQDIKRLKELHDQVKEANAEEPVNMAKVATLQSQIAELEARGQSEGMSFQNQRALMLLAGADGAHEVYMEMLRESPTWQRHSGLAMSAFAGAFRKRRPVRRRVRVESSFERLGFMRRQLRRANRRAASRSDVPQGRVV